MKIFVLKIESPLYIALTEGTEQTTSGSQGGQEESQYHLLIKMMLQQSEIRFGMNSTLFLVLIHLLLKDLRDQ